MGVHLNKLDAICQVVRSRDRLPSVATTSARTTTARGDAAREAILDAAFVRFSGYGLRRTSMEDIAREAHVSRASIYFHFGSKDQVFRALAERLHEQNLAAMVAAAKAPGPLEDRIRGALEARLVSFVEITHSSPHGDELLDEHSRVCGDVAAASNEASLRILRGLVREGTAVRRARPDGRRALRGDRRRDPARLRRGRQDRPGRRTRGIPPAAGADRAHAGGGHAARALSPAAPPDRLNAGGTRSSLVAQWPRPRITSTR